MILAMSHLYLMGGHSKSAGRRLEKLLFVQKNRAGIVLELEKCKEIPFLNYITIMMHNCCIITCGKTHLHILLFVK